jgi:hypothetical protein
MNRTTAACIAGTRSKTTSTIKTHFRRRKKPREAKPFTRLRGFELCECSESVIVFRLTADPMTFVRAIPCPAVASCRAVAQRRMMAMEDVLCAVCTSAQ